MMKGADSGPGINLKMSHVFPLAILLHTAMDFIVGLTSAGVWNLPVWSVEGMLAIFGVLTFCGAFFMLYKKDVRNEAIS